LLASENIDPYTIDTQIQDIVRKYFGEGVTFGIPFNT
jgi:hypothetical protein